MNCTIKTSYTINAHGEVEVQLQPFLTLALHTADRFAACTNRFTPRESALSTHSIWGWVNPRASLDCSEKIQVSYRARNQDLISAVPSKEMHKSEPTKMQTIAIMFNLGPKHI